MNSKIFYTNCFVFLLQIQNICSNGHDGKLQKVQIHEDVASAWDEEKYVDTGWIDFNDMENYGIPKIARCE